MEQPYRVLMVCTGNICRSPAAAAWMSVLGDGSLAVSSAGTAALVDAGVHPRMADLMRQAGLPVDGFRSRQLTPAMIKQADLLLTMTAQHRRWIVDRVPAAVRRTFTLLEFAHLARLAPPPAGEPGPTEARTRAAVLHDLRVATPRGRTRLHLDESEAGIDVPDPYGRDQAAYELAFGLIREAVRGIAGPPAPPPAA